MQGLIVRHNISAAFMPEHWGLTGDAAETEVATEMLNEALEEAVNSEGSNASFVYESMASVQSQLGDVEIDNETATALVEQVVNTVFGQS